jgi:hypothetical protein
MAEGLEPVALQVRFSEAFSFLQTLADFQHRLALAKQFVPRTGAPVWSETLAQTADYRLSLMSLHASKPIPLHDHPAASGAQWIIAGRVRIQHFAEAPDRQSPLAVVWLEPTVDEVVRPRGLSLLDRGWRNIHSLEALSERALLLSVQWPACDADQQNWYFPIALNGADGSRQAYKRVRRKPLN